MDTRQLHFNQLMQTFTNLNRLKSRISEGPLYPVDSGSLSLLILCFDRISLEFYIDIELISKCSELISVCFELISECSELISECFELISECSELISECFELISECSELISECSELISECSELISECSEFDIGVF